MSNSKPLPPFTFDLLCYLNRDQLERLSIVCRPLKNYIDRYFNAKPYRVFDQMRIRGGSYALRHKGVRWHPNRDDYSAQQFLEGQKCNIDNHQDYYKYFSFAEMHPYLGPSVRIKKIHIFVAAGSTYSPEHIAEMESIAYLWHDGKISIWKSKQEHIRIVSEDLLLILNSPTILQCRSLFMDNVHFSFKDYKLFYAVNVIGIGYNNKEIDYSYWLQFLEQPGVKPIVILHRLHRESINNVLDQLSKAFPSALSPNAFKIVFSGNDELNEFRETNSTSREKLELKKGFPTEYQSDYWNEYINYTLERSSI